jgi:hypothetical protein
MLLSTASNIHLERLHQRQYLVDSASSRYLQRGLYMRRGNTVSLHAREHMSVRRVAKSCLTTVLVSLKAYRTFQHTLPEIGSPVFNFGTDHTVRSHPFVVVHL